MVSIHTFTLSVMNAARSRMSGGVSRLIAWVSMSVSLRVSGVSGGVTSLQVAVRSVSRESPAAGFLAADEIIDEGKNQSERVLVTTVTAVVTPTADVAAVVTATATAVVVTVIT